MAKKYDYHSFWEALIITIFIFGLGILIGIFIENNRSDAISEIYLESEINLLDLKIQSQAFDLSGLDCQKAKESNIEFGDRVYEEAKLLSRYETANQLTDVILEQHKRYDLLRTMFWINSINIKEKCGGFSTVVYLYNYGPEDIEEKNKQKVFSNFLAELKEKKADQMVLIPIAMNLNLSSINYMAQTHNISETSILVDESLVVTELDELGRISEYFELYNKTQ